MRVGVRMIQCLSYTPLSSIPTLWRTQLFTRSVLGRAVATPLHRSQRHSGRKNSNFVTMASVTYLTQSQAIAIDEELMGPLGFSVDQLMELAGLSVACSVSAEYPRNKCSRVLVIAGPGNNGGDGLVAAKHLHHFGYNVQVCYPKPIEKPLYKGLVTQCTSLGIPMQNWSDLKVEPLARKFDVVIDAMFGFSFKGDPRPPFDEILQFLKPSASPPAIVSVDIPSGWHVEEGDIGGNGIQPDMLGRYHYLGGRFVPPAIQQKYDLQLPKYPGISMCTKIESQEDLAAHKVADMRISYEKGGLLEEHMKAEPMSMFDSWFKEALDQKVCEEVNAIALASSDAQGHPSVRMVLLKGYDERGFVFYTNYNSRKGRDLASTGHAAFTVYWEKLQRQVRVEGTVEKLSEEESSEYYHSRPRGSQIGAWVSDQSAVLNNGRQELEDRYHELQQQYSDASVPVPKPPHWGGFLIRPLVVEFWQGRPSRLHDRLQYRRPSTASARWTMERLQP